MISAHRDSDIRTRFYRPVVTLLFTGLVLAHVATARAQAPELAKPSDAAIALYAEAANLQNNNEFELAAELWEQFLKKNPAVELTPKAQHFAGICYLQIQKYDQAAEHFQQVVTKWSKVPDFNLLEDAYLNLGWCQFTLGQRAKTNEEAATSFGHAAKSLADSAKAYPKGKYIDQVLFFLAESLYLQGNKPEAIAAYSLLVKEHPESQQRASALYGLGVTLEESNDFAQAGTVYDTFIKEFEDHKLIDEIRMRKAETLLQAALAAQQSGEDAEAQKLLGQADVMFAAVIETPGFPLADHAIMRRALTLTNLGKVLEAAKLYERIPTEFKDSPNVNLATLYAGRYYYRGDAFDEALKWFQQAVKNDPANAAEAAHWTCKIHLRKDEAAKAYDLATKTLTQAGDSEFAVRLKMDQADAAFELDDKRTESVDLYLAIYANHGDDELAPDALYNAAFTCQALGRYEEGLQHAAEFLSKYAEHRFVPDVKYVAAECNLHLEKLDEAQEIYRDLAQSHAGHADADIWQLRLGLCLYLQKKYDETVAALSPLVANFKQPDQVAEAQFLVGGSQLQLNQYGPAATALAAALAANPKWQKADETTLLLAQAQFKDGKTDEAIATIKQLIGNFADSTLLDQAHYRLGEYSYAKKDLKTSIAEYSHVIEGWPKSPFAPYSHYGKGWSQLDDGDYVAAASSFTSLLTEFPKHALAPETQFARGMARRQTGDFPGATEDLAGFLKSNPAGDAKTNALYELGLAQIGQKSYADAAKSFSQLLQENPKASVADRALYELAWAQRNDGKQDEALVSFTKLISDYADSRHAAEGHFHVGEDLYGKEEWTKALDHYMQSKQLAKQDALKEQAIYKLGWSQYKLGAFDEALTEFQEQVGAYPAGAFNTEAQFMVAESLFELKQYDEAFAAFSKARAAIEAAEKIPESYKVLTLLHGGQSAIKAEKWAEALAFLETIPATYKDSPLLAEAQFEIGQALLGQKMNSEAEAAFEVAAIKSLGEVGARGRFMVGEIHFLEKDYDEAIKHFKRVAYGYKTAPDSVKAWQAKAGYEAARCYEVRIATTQDAAARAELIDGAKTMYGYVAKEHPTTKEAVEAKKRLTELAKLE